LANVISDPLGTIFQGLLGSFDPMFLAFALIIGYLTFFLFFYGTDKWKSIDWVERFFFGFLFGMFSGLVFLVFLFIPIAFILMVTFSDNIIAVAIYAGPIFFLVFFSILRLYLKNPLCSDSMRNEFLNWFQKNVTFAPLILLISSGILVTGVLFNNPFFSSYNSSVWIGFLVYLNLGLFSYVISMTNFALMLASLSGNLQPPAFFYATVNWYWGSALKYLSVFLKRKNCSELQKIYNQERKFFFKAMIRSKVLKILLITVLICTLFVSLDRSFGIISPSIQVVDSMSSQNIEVNRWFNGSFVYLEKMTNIYWIRLPLINFRNFNLSITNPSNLGMDFMANINTRYMINVVPSVSIGDSLNYTSVKSTDGRLLSLDVDTINTSTNSESNSNVTITYYNQINLDLVKITEPEETRFENGSILVSTTLSIADPINSELTFESLPVIPLNFFNNIGNITSFSANINQNKVTQYEIFENWLLLPTFNVFPGRPENISINAIFGG
jgi:hypothetical protein